MSPKITPLICSMNSGEITPKVDSRTDITKYYNGCRTLENFIPMVEGGVMRVPGTYFVVESKTSATKCRLKAFHFSTEQAYIIEMGNLYFRFFKDGGQIVVDTSMSDWNPVTDYGVNGLGEFVKIGANLAINAGGGNKYLHITSPYGLSGATTVKVGCQSNTSDNLSVTATGDTITIKLADTTSTKNRASLIQTALRALGTVNSVSVAAWTVTENSAYAAARPTSGVNIAATLMVDVSKMYRNIARATGTSYNGNKHPKDTVDTGYWTEFALGAAVEIPTTYTEDEVFAISGPQSADILYLFHENHSPAKLIRHSHIWWELIDMVCVDKNAKTITGITRENPGIVTCLNHGFRDGDFVFITDVKGMTEVNDLPFTVVIPGTGWSDDEKRDMFKLQGVDTTSYTPYESGGLVGYGITGITKANPAVVTMPHHGFEDGDRIYIFGVGGMTELNGNTYTVANMTSSTFELEGINSSSYGTYTSGGTGWTRLFYETDYYPSCGAFFEQRLYKAGSKNEPQTIYGSVVSDYENHNQDPASDDAAIEYTIPGAHNRVDRIRWMIGEEYLIIGTSGAIQKLGASTTVEPLTQINVSVRPHIGLGVAKVDPEMVIDSILWLTRDAKSVRQIIWTLEQERYTAPNMTRLASHIPYGATEATSGIKQFAFQKEPIPILWAIRNDGQLLGMTYEIQEAVYAWFRVITDGLFESVAVISKDSEEDEVWVVANRTIGGTTKRYIEYLTHQNFYGDKNEAFFIHSGLSSTLVNATQLTGLLHLAAKDVDVMIGGVYIGRKTVSGGGVVTLGGTYSGRCHVGLPFTAKVEPMKLEAGSRVGAARSKKQKINRVNVALYQTYGGKVGPDSSNLVNLMNFFETTPAVGTLVTDDALVEFPGDWMNETTLCIVQDEPYPMTLLALIPRLSVYED